MQPDPVDTWATAGFAEKPSPNVFVQWKGTDVCLDFHCTCGAVGHYDGDFAYQLRCPACGQVWQLPHTFGLLPGADDGTATRTPAADTEDEV